jgi:hypothetical protein
MNRVKFLTPVLVLMFEVSKNIEVWKFTGRTCVVDARRIALDH